MPKKERPQLDLFKTKATDQIQKRFASLIRLAERGATEGEKAAARKAMERLQMKYDFDSLNLDELLRSEYCFTWTSNIEIKLFIVLCKYFLNREDFIVEKRNWREENGELYEARELAIKLDQMEYITIECAYEYFRRHMNSEWKRLIIPKLNRCRKARTRKAKKETLEPLFFEQYIIRSQLVNPEHLTELDPEEMSQQEIENRAAMTGMQGGAFNRQVGTGLYLNS
ncbi:hypothetical protein [Gracilimonas tropica]|uniref:hypothetical protein n=1 Tax=Gracilimonas tropica TaxID=454600 RepID=UPI00037050B3|nr:hypothetical protein [Gracilimonas tropica]